MENQRPPFLTLKSLTQIQSLQNLNVRELSSPSLESLHAALTKIIDQDSPSEPFYVMDLGKLVTLYHTWCHNFPTIKPYFPVRCNPNHVLLVTLAALGANFDCASRAEIASVLALNVAPDRIIFSNACKAEDHIKYAAGVGVHTLAFDSAEELEKVRKHHPHCSLVLHIHVARIEETGHKKYGALPHEVLPLLKLVQRLRLVLAGVSFESGGSIARPAALEAARAAFDAAVSQGLPRPRVIGLGGGFNSSASFAEEAATIHRVLQSKFPDHASISVIASPGRFLAGAACVLMTNVIGKRVRGDLREYWINDGVYGSMNGVIYRQMELHAIPFGYVSNHSNPTCTGLPTFRSTVFGPTCDALDTVFKDRALPELCIGDWLCFPNMGAYSQAAGTNFNGFFTSSICTKFTFSKPCKA